MAPKEKALELVEKFKINDYDWISQGNLYCVMQHAMFTVNSIINEQTIITNDLNLENEEQINYMKRVNLYWNEVKKELELLYN